MAAQEGDEILTPPGGLPPAAPPGFHWKLVRVIFSDTGGASLWQLVKNDPAASDFVQGLSNDLLAGLLSLFRGLGIGTGSSAGKAHNTVVFCGTSSPFNMSWTPDDDFFITGWSPQAGQMLSVNGSYANYAAAINQNGLLVDVLLLSPVSSSITAAMGDVQIPIFKGTKLYFYSNVAGCAQVYLQPQQQPNQ